MDNEGDVIVEPDSVIASAGDDRVQGGLGDDQGGDDVLEGGDSKDKRTECAI